jgi:hypothetical protein
MAPSSKKSASLSPPVGLPLGNSCTIGELIGQGAFGQVHAIIDKKTGKPTKFVVKLTKVSNPTKTQRTAPEIASQKLWLEFLVYSQHVRSLTGTYLPSLPNPRKDGLQEYYNENEGSCQWYRSLECVFCWMDAQKIVTIFLYLHT